MVVGIGIDLQEIADFHRTLVRAGDAYIQRIFTATEIAYCQAKPDPSSSFAVRFAAKEAAIKALGIAGTEGLGWHDFEISTDASERPYVTLGGVAARCASEKTVTSLVISLTHSRSTAAAVVVAETHGYPIERNQPMHNPSG